MSTLLVIHRIGLCSIPATRSMPRLQLTMPFTVWCIFALRLLRGNFGVTIEVSEVNGLGKLVPSDGSSWIQICRTLGSSRLKVVGMTAAMLCPTEQNTAAWEPWQTRCLPPSTVADQHSSQPLTLSTVPEV
eukprot:875435-Rhodomonas_salina.1